MGKTFPQANALHYITNPSAKKIYSEVQKLTGFEQGKPSAPQITIIMDPNSNLFPEQWDQVAYDAAQGDFSVHWLLVNYLKPTGPNVAGYIMQAKNRIAALGYNATHYNASTQTGGYVKSVKISKKTKQILADNWDFIQKHNLYKMPVTIFKHNKRYYVLQGVVSNEALEGIFFGDTRKTQ